MAGELRLHARTHVGRLRDHNEDDFLCDPARGLFLVADGMGGLSGGEVASRLAARAVAEALEREWGLVEAFSVGDARAERLKHLMGAAAGQANTVVHAAAEADPGRRAMGSTLTAVLVVGCNAFVAHVGDSRLYLVRGGEVRQVTEDHSVINELRRRGRLRPELLAQLEAKTVVTRAVGVFATVEVDTAHVLLAPGDRLLLCSDGLHRYVSEDRELAALLHGLSEEAATQKLVELALERGGADDVTAVVVTLPGEDEQAVARDLARSYEALSRTPFFRDLEVRELLQVQALARLREHSHGDVVVAEGSPGDAMYILLSGGCVVRKGGVDLARLLPGEHFGEMALVDRAPRSASVVVEGEARLLEISRDDLFRLLRECQATGYKLLFNLLHVLAQRLRQTSEDLGEAMVPRSEAPSARAPGHPSGPHDEASADTWPPPPSTPDDEATDPAIPAPPLAPDLTE